MIERCMALSRTSFRPEQLFQTAALSRDDVFVGLSCGVDGNAGDTKHFRTAFWEEFILGGVVLPQSVFPLPQPQGC